MKTGRYIRSLMRPVSPHQEELDRLVDLRANGFITEADYRNAKRDVQQAQREAAGAR